MEVEKDCLEVEEGKEESDGMSREEEEEAVGAIIFIWEKKKGRKRDQSK